MPASAMSLKAGLGAVSLLGHNMTTLPKMQHLDAGFVDVWYR